jgi:cell division protein FtsN
MEQKRLLWIILTVALLLLVVIGAGIIWFFPDGKKGEAGPTPLTGAEEYPEFDPIEWVREDGEYPGLEQKEEVTEAEKEDEDFVVVYGETEEKEKEGKEAAKEAEAEEEARQPEPEEKQKAPEKKVTRQPVEKTPPPEPKKEPRKVRVAEYWIQTGSYTNQTRAQGVKEELAKKGVASVITSKEINSKTYFRVRIGPYSSKSEAQKFLEWIRSMHGFSNSYISRVYTTKTQIN